MKALAWRLLNRGYKRVLFVLAIGLLGSGLGFLVLQVRVLGPVGSWQQQPQPPARLTHFVTDAYQPSPEGQVYASTADGTLYALACPGASCAWSKQDALPPLTDPRYVSCLESFNAAAGSTRMPKAPGRVVDTHATRVCLTIDYWRDSYFILLEDGSVWKWERQHGGPGGGYFVVAAMTVMWTACCGVGGLILGLRVVLVAVRVAAGRSRSAS